MGDNISLSPFIYFLLSLLGAGIGAYFGSYLREKGKNLATHEDIDRVVRATEDIKAQISGNLWMRQRRDEIRLGAINEYLRATNAYVASALVNPNPQTPVIKWFEDFNIAVQRIRVLFSDSTYQAAQAVDRLIVPFGTWAVLAGRDRRDRANAFAEACHVALTALYGEVFGDGG